MTPGAPRQRLLDAAIDYVAGHGFTDLSLRRLAAELGTSHRMLSHHFGSKEGLWVAIVEEVERRQAATLTDLPDDPAAAVAAMWAAVRKPELRPFERLFFECYARGAQGDALTTAAAYLRNLTPVARTTTFLIYDIEPSRETARAGGPTVR